jgi:hypothetical protein
LFQAYSAPEPEIVNPSLPDQASLERGRAALVAACPEWQDSREFGELVERRVRLRDEELWQAVEEGWRSLPACDTGLPESERWDIVNALRALEPRDEEEV